jgi:hypothetical protein
MSKENLKHGKPMRVESWLFVVGGLVFTPMAVVYGLLSDWEPVGTTALFLLGGFGSLVGGYLFVVGSRVDARPEDNPLGNIDEAAGEVGTFSPWSWWPLVLGVATALVFLGLAVGVWLSGIGFVIGVIGLVGQQFEFSRGQHAH